MMVRILNDAGCVPLVSVANHDSQLQVSQIREMVSNGAKAIIVVAEDGKALAPLVDELAARGIKIVAYDRLIPTSSIAIYVSFDLVEIGRRQAEGILAAMKQPLGGRIVLLGGSPTNVPASFLFRKGQLEVLQPYIARGDMKVVADRWVENWNPANAEKDIRQIIIETGGKFDAVVASNDGTALGALRALKEAGLAGKVFISGQDATAAGCNSIARRELTVTVLKDTRLFAPAVCEIAIKLARDEAVQGLVVRSLSEYMNDPSLAGNVCCKFLPVALITRENLKQLVVDSGFQSYEGVYAGVENPPPR